MRRMRCTVLIGVAGLLAVAANAFGVPIRSGVAGDALWFAHLDLQALKQTVVGQHILNGLREGAADHRLAALTAVLNFDPRSDLHSLQVYGRGQDGDGAAIVRGKFDAQRLITLVQAAEGYSSQDYFGHRLHTWIDRKRGAEKRATGSVYNGETVVFADSLDVLKRSIDVLDGRTPALTKVERFPGLSETGPAVFLLAAADIASMASTQPRAEAFKAVSSAVLSVAETDGKLSARIVIETPHSESADNIKKILDGMVALARLNSENDPAAARLADGSDVAQDGQRLTVNLRIPVEDVIAHIEKNRPHAE